MDIFSVLSLAGGLALFLYGMELMGSGLKKLAGGKLEAFLGNLTSNKYKSFFLGLIVTAVIQSSSATTVMVVGFVNSGIMRLSQTIGIIMGANIGTTVTAWLLSLSGISGTSFFLKLLKPETFTPVLAIIGVIMMMVCESDKRKNIGTILIGFAILMFGMETMSGSMSGSVSGSMNGIEGSESFSRLLVILSNPIMGILVGTLLTALIQSSSASVGILQALALTGTIPYSTALPIILGQNIGATITPILSSLSGNVNAKRVAMACLYIKMIGVAVVAVGFYLLHGIFDFQIMSQNITVMEIAVVHTAFNVISTVILMPFEKQIEKLACRTIRGDRDDDRDVFATLDDRFLSVPSFAVEKSRKLAFEMAEITRDSLIKAMALLDKFDKTTAKKIEESEGEIDRYEDKLSAYLVKLAGREMSAADSLEVTRLLHAVGDIERISDHSVNVMRVAQEMNEKNIVFSSSAVEDIAVITEAVKEIISLTVCSLINNDYEEAKKVEPLDQIIDKLKYKIKNNHIQRLREGGCTVEMGFILSDLLTTYERVAGHCSNIAVCMLEPDNDSLESHEYLSHVKNDAEGDFADQYDRYKKKYALPSAKK